YDYIGAPWLRQNVYPDVVKMLKETAVGYVSRFLNLKDPVTGLPSVRQLENRVGNGGLSLRRTQIFFDSCLRKKAAINKYLDQPEHMFNEDVFWSIEMNRYRKVLSIPSYKTAAHFAMERSPEIALAYTDGELPFGCHAWDRNMDFYRPIFRAYGYSM